MIEPMGQKGFERTGKVFDALENAAGKIPAKFHVPSVEHVPQGWEREAEWAFRDESPIRTRYLIYIILAIFIAAALWTALATIDEVVSGSGKVVTKSGTQIVQSIDGGMVQEIFVQEAETVEKDQVLIRLDQTRFSSNLGERRSQVLALTAKLERLRALTQDSEFSIPKELSDEIPHIVAYEASLYTSAREEMNSAIRTANDQLAQRKQELLEASSRLSQFSNAAKLAQKELDATKQLLQSGAVSQLEVVRLEKDVSRSKADIDQARAQVARARSAIEESNGQIRDIELRFMNNWKNELSVTIMEKESLEEGNKALADRVSHSEIRSPMSGTIKRLLVNTVGAVVMPGGTVAEIVAQDDDVKIEAQLSPTDRAFAKPGQRVVLKFTAYDFAIYGGLDGIVEDIAPDTITDERGNSHYSINVRPEKTSFGENRPILPGMVAQVDIITGKKTILEYILKPLFRAKDKALTER